MLAQVQTTFPPWYFWFFVFAVVLVVVPSLATLIVTIHRINSNQRIKERELAVNLIETISRDRSLTPKEVDQLLNSYWRLGSPWGRVRQLWAELRLPRDDHPQKPTPRKGTYEV